LSKLAEPLTVEQQTNKDAIKQVLQAGLFGLGIGAGGRAFMGLRDMLAYRPYTPPKVGIRPSVVELNLPQAQQEEEDKRRLRKTAEIPGPQTVADALNSPTDNWLVDRLKGLKNVKPMFKPWFLPSIIGAGGLGALAGYKAVGAGTDYVQDRNRKQELEDAKREYRNALVEQYNVDKQSADSASATLDRVASRFVKQAGSINDYASLGLGTYITLAGLLAGGAGYGTYNWVKDRAPENRLAKAIKQRERLRWATRPPEIYAVTKPVLPGQTTALEEEDQDAKNEDQAKARRAPTMPKLGAAEMAVAALYKLAAGGDFTLPGPLPEGEYMPGWAKPALPGAGLAFPKPAQPNVGLNKPVTGNAGLSTVKPSMNNFPRTNTKVPFARFMLGIDIQRAAEESMKPRPVLDRPPPPPSAIPLPGPLDRPRKPDMRMEDTYSKKFPHPWYRLRQMPREED
jgi:hypothetical protein